LLSVLKKELWQYKTYFIQYSEAPIKTMPCYSKLQSVSDSHKTIENEA